MFLLLSQVPALRCRNERGPEHHFELLVQVFVKHCQVTRAQFNPDCLPPHVRDYSDVGTVGEDRQLR